MIRLYCDVCSFSLDIHFCQVTHVGMGVCLYGVRLHQSMLLLISHVHEAGLVL
jgi:hypothetical protein